MTKSYFYTHKNITYSDLNPGAPSTSPNDSKIHIIFTYAPADNVTKGIADLGGYTACFFSLADKTTYSHEMGHLLNLDHTFESPYNIPMHNTYNIMDYALTVNGITPKLNMFYYSQWTQIY